MNPIKLALCLIPFFVACQNNNSENIDPIEAQLIIEDQIAEFETLEYPNQKDTFYLGSEGSIVSFPANAWLDADGNPYQGEVKLKIVEALTDDQIMLNGLSTISQLGEVLETGGMVYVSATGNDQVLRVDPTNGPMISIPTENFDPEMQHYHGVLGKDSILTWEKESAIPKYLTVVALEELNFRNSGFDQQFKKSIPLGQIKEFSMKTADSLYVLYSSLKEESQKSRPSELAESNYQDDSTAVSAADQVAATSGTPFGCIDPAIAIGLKQERFKNTYVSTVEFQSRIQALYGLCENGKYLDVYINNLAVDLYIADSIVHSMIPEDAREKQTFYKFYKERLTNVKQLDPQASLLADHLKKVAEKLKREIRNNYQELELNRKDKIKMNRLKKRLKQLKKNREKVYMRRYNYKMTRSGWQNVDKPLTELQKEKLAKKGVEIRYFREQQIRVNLVSSMQLANPQVYLSFPEYKSILRLEHVSGNQYVSRRTDYANSYPMAYNIPVDLICFDANEGLSVFKKQSFLPDSSGVNQINVELNGDNQLTYQALKTRLKQEDRFRKRSNSLSVDLEIHREMGELKKKEDEIKRTNKRIRELGMYAHTCCHSRSLAIFEAKCSSCHWMNDRPLIGPGMKGVTSRWKNRDLISFIQSSQNYLKTHPNDDYANNLYRSYGMTIMTDNNLSRTEIDALLHTIDYYNDMKE